MKGLAPILVSLFLGTAVTAATAGDESPRRRSEAAGLLVSKVSVDREVFCPTSNETVRVRFHLSEAASISVSVLGPDGEVIAPVSRSAATGAGLREVSWNGRDAEGTVVPDEAYTFAIEAKNRSETAIFNPFARWEGIQHEIRDLRVDRKVGVVEYEIPCDARVRLQAGIVDGALLAVPVDWQPRTRGRQQEKWNGKDLSGVFQIFDHPRFKVRASYVALPPLSVIASGNRNAVWKSLGRPAGRKPSTAVPSWSTQQSTASVLASSLAKRGLSKSRIVPLDLALKEPEAGNRVPTLRVDFRPGHVNLWVGSLFEAYFYVDHVFWLEDQGVPLPHERKVDMKWANGQSHFLTVNILQQGDVVGIATIELKPEQLAALGVEHR